MNNFIQKVKEHAAAIVIGAIVMIVLILAVIVFVLARSGNTDRKLIIEDIAGSAFILKTDGQVSADKKMKVESGDVLITAADSTVRLSVDKDKSIYIEPETTLYIYYTDTADKGSIVVNVSEGGAVCRLDSKLGKNEIFQVKTPNAVISAGGTVFRTEFNYYDKYGNYTAAKVTDVDCVEGNVDIQLYDNSASPAEPLMMLTEGNSTRLLTAEETVRYEFLNSDIQLGLLKEDAINTFIRIAAERKICFSLSELNEAYQAHLNGETSSGQETSGFDFDKFTEPPAITTAIPMISDTTEDTEPVMPGEISSDITEPEFTGLPPEETQSVSDSESETVTTVPENAAESVISVTSPTTAIYTVSGGTGTTVSQTSAAVTTAANTTVLPPVTTAAPTATLPPQTSAAVTAATTVSQTAPPAVTSAPAVTTTTETAAATESETQTAASETTSAPAVTTKKPAETTVPWWEIINSAALTQESDS